MNIKKLVSGLIISTIGMIMSMFVFSPMQALAVLLFASGGIIWLEGKLEN